MEFEMVEDENCLHCKIMGFLKTQTILGIEGPEACTALANCIVDVLTSDLKHDRIDPDDLPSIIDRIQSYVSFGISARLLQSSGESHAKAN